MSHVARVQSIGDYTGWPVEKLSGGQAVWLADAALGDKDLHYFSKKQMAEMLSSYDCVKEGKDVVEKHSKSVTGKVDCLVVTKIQSDGLEMALLDDQLQELVKNQLSKTPESPSYSAILAMKGDHEGFLCQLGKDCKHVGNHVLPWPHEKHDDNDGKAGHRIFGTTGTKRAGHAAGDMKQRKLEVMSRKSKGNDASEA